MEGAPGGQSHLHSAGPSEHAHLLDALQRWRMRMQVQEGAETCLANRAGLPMERDAGLGAHEAVSTGPGRGAQARRRL